ncbi:MAG: hypothetical protein ACLPYS_05420 [Vulcanimicrobiaceae bacterium]
MLRKCCGAVAAALATLLIGNLPAGAASPGGTSITNVASATYSDGNNSLYAAQSNQVVITTAAVGALLVTPNDSSCSNAFAVGSLVKETFTITNTSNIADAYTITSASTSAGTLTGISFIGASGTTPVSVGTTVSPTLSPGQSLQVQLTLSTTGVAVGTHVTLSLTARTSVSGTVNGLQSQSGAQCLLAAAGASFSGPGDPKSLVSKLVNDAHTFATQPGTSVTYTIAMQNSGGVPSYNTELVDVIPAGVTPVTTSVTLNGVAVPHGAVTLVGQTLTVPLGTVVAGAVDTVAFNAAVAAGFADGITLVNTASVKADNAAPTSTIPATVLLGTANIVYNGVVGQTAPVAGATLQLVDHASGAPLSLTAKSAAGTLALNPFVTGPGGSYTFALTPAQLGTPTNPAAYDLLITTPGYLNRHIQVTLTPDATFTVATVALQALDGQQLAAAGGFSLVVGPVSIADIAGYFGNIPLFPQGALQITKTGDRTTVSGGDRIVFTLQYANAGSAPLGPTNVTDTLPPGLLYAPGTSLVDGTRLEPVRNGNVLTWSFASLSGNHTITYATVVAPSMEADVTLTNRVTIAATPGSGGTPLTASASADVQTVAGVFSDRIVITGRVYIDPAGVGRVVPGDKGVAGVRLFLEDGESVLTDQFGRFSFPAARPGMHVLRLDETTLPQGLRAFPIHSFDDERSTRRLVHGILDSGTLQDVNFAVSNGA